MQDLPDDLTHTRIVRMMDRLSVLEAENQRLVAQVESDKLTGIKNEAGLKRIVGGRKGWYVLADLNAFKHVNDRHGHAAGDSILCEFATFLVSNTRPCDAVAARLHGDEFVVWVENRAGARRIKTLIRKWRSGLYREASAAAGMGDTLTSADAAMFLDEQRRKKRAA